MRAPALAVLAILTLLAVAPARANWCGDAGAPTLERGLPLVVGETPMGREYVRLPAEIGQDLVAFATLHGRGDVDLHLYDPACRPLVPGATDISPEGGLGGPEVLTYAPTMTTGAYWLELHFEGRVDGWTLAYDARDTMPTLPRNDAGTGQDASDEWASPTRLDPSGVWQARFEADDTLDVYHFAAADGAVVTVTWLSSAPNTMTAAMHRRDPGGLGFEEPRAFTAFGGAMRTLPMSGDADLRLTFQRGIGGGNYLFAVHVEPPRS